MLHDYKTMWIRSSISSLERRYELTRFQTVLCLAVLPLCWTCSSFKALIDWSRFRVLFQFTLFSRKDTSVMCSAVGMESACLMGSFGGLHSQACPWSSWQTSKIFFNFNLMLVLGRIEFHSFWSVSDKILAQQLISYLVSTIKFAVIVRKERRVVLTKENYCSSPFRIAANSIVLLNGRYQQYKIIKYRLLSAE